MFFPDTYNRNDDIIFLTISIFTDFRKYFSIMSITFVKTNLNIMKKITIILFSLSLSFLGSCKKSNAGENDLTKDFEDSYKEKIAVGTVDTKQDFLIDSVNNMYYNFRYKFSFKYPKNWKVDSGLTKNTIFNATEIDSAISFKVIAVELIKDSESYNMQDAIYNKNAIEINELKKIIKRNVEELTKLQIENYKFEKSYIKNYSAFKSSWNYIIKDTEYEYDFKGIIYNYWRAPYSYTIAVTLPLEFYEGNEEYYNNLFSNYYPTN